MNPLLKQYLEGKLGADYAQKQQQDIESTQSGARLGNLFGDLGDVIAGKSIGSTDAYFQDVVKSKQNQYADKEKKALAEYDLEKSMQSDAQAQEKAKRESDINSEDSRLAQQLAVKMGMNPEQAKALSAARFKELSPVMQKMYEIESKKEENNLKRQENQIKRQEQQREKDLKLADLNATQAKQLGLYKLGEKAESQFQKATTGKGAFNPTEVGQIIDNSTSLFPNFMKDPKAVEAQAAMSSWVEVFLRDASGAAIPPSERLSYAKDYFPQPGDSADVVKNKQELRLQKMQNALQAAGPGAKQIQSLGGKKIVKTQTNKATGEKRVVYDDGSTEIIKSVAGGG